MGIDISIKQRLFQIAEIVHLRVFGHAMSDEMRKFLGNLSWSFFGGIVAAGMFFIFVTLSGHWLGPDNFGKFSLALSGSYFFSLLMLVGLDTASIRFLIRKEVELSYLYRFLKKRFIISVCLNIVLFGLLLPVLSDFLKVESSILIVSFIVGLTFSVRSISEIILRGTQDFKFQSNLRFIESASVLIIFFVCSFFFRWEFFWVYLMILAVGYSIYSFIVFKNRMAFLVKNVSVVEYPKEKLEKNFYQYAAFAFLGGLSGIFMAYSDKFFINHFLPAEDLGIYSAYYMSSALLASQLALLTVNVLFPAAVSLNDISVVFQKLNKFFLLSAIPITAGIALFIVIALFLFGGEYPVIPSTVLVFSVYSLLLFYFSLVWWLIASQGINGIRFTSLNGMLSVFLMLSGFFLFSNSLSIEISVLLIMLPIVYNICIANFFYARKRKS